MGKRLSRLPGGPAVLVAIGLVALAALGLAALELARGDRVAEGVSVDGVDIGGRSADEAAAVVRAEIAGPLERTVVVARGDREVELDPSEAGLEVDVQATVDAAMARSREGVPGLRTLGDALGLREVDVDLEPRIGYSQRAVRSFVARAARRLGRRPRDAAVEPSAAGLETTAARVGFEVDRPELRDRVATALQSPDRHAVQAPGERVAPQTTLGDLAERHPHYIVIDRESFRLRHYVDLERETVYRISVGQAGHRTPAGLYEITSKAVNPTWYVPDAEWAGELAGQEVPPGPDNPIKSRWLGIEDGVGIHGTDQVDSIGRRASHGCIRMLIPEVKELYDAVPIGTATYIA